MNHKQLLVLRSRFDYQLLTYRLTSLVLTMCILLGTVYFALPPSVAHASCMAPKGEILGNWVNIQDVIGAEGAVIHQLEFDSGCSYSTDCEEGSPCSVTASSGFWANLHYACNGNEDCTWNNELSMDSARRQSWLSGEMGSGIFNLSAYLVGGRYGFTQLTVEWGLDFPDNNGNADFSQTEYFVRDEDMEAYFEAYSSAIYVTPPQSTATPWPTPTPIQQPVEVVAPFQTLQPANGACLSHGAQFEWQDNVGLATGHLYEIVVWRAGEDPISSGRGITKPDTRTSRWLDLDYLDNQRDWFAPGDYYWGVLEITGEPYQRHKLLGIGSWFRYVRGAPCNS